MLAWVQEPESMFWQFENHQSSPANFILTAEEIKEIENKEKWFTQSHIADVEQEPGSLGLFSQFGAFPTVIRLNLLHVPLIEKNLGYFKNISDI